MQLIQFLAAWLFPDAQCFAVDMANDDYSELDRASSSPSFSANAAGSGSSLSSPSSTSSSDGHRGFFKSRSRQESPSTTPLCFGAGGGGAGRRLLRGSRERAPAKQQPQEESAVTMAPKVKGDMVGRYLRKISRRLRKARSDGKRSSSPMAAAADDTARERAESVARAISYCKDTLRRGKSRSRSPSPPPPPSPSLDEWLPDRQEEIIATAAVHCDECSDPRPSPPRPRRAARWPLGMQTMAKRFKESPCPCPSSPSRDSLLAACAVAHGEESPQPHHGHGRLSLLATRHPMQCNPDAVAKSIV
jgi:hypothetical protein